MRSALKLVALLSAVAFAFLIGVGFGQSSGGAGGPFSWLGNSPDTATFKQAAGLVKSDYYRPLSDAQIQDAAISGVVSKLGDRFSAYLDPREYSIFQKHQNPHFSGIGLDVRFKPNGLYVVKPYPGTPAEKAGIKPGDLVISAEGKSFTGKRGDAAVALIQGKPGTFVTVEVRSPNGKVRTLRVERKRILLPSVESKTVTGPNGIKVGVVALSGFVQGAGAQVSQAVKAQLAAGAKAIVLDLRGNGGGLLDEAVSVASVFIDRGTIVVTKGRSRARQVYSASGTSIPAKVPVVVLVDGNTASASEIVAGAIQDRKRGVIVGSHTFGKGVFQEVTQLRNGGALDITVGEYFTPSGRNLGGGGVKQGAGVRPDLPVKASAGTQAALDAAISAAESRVK